MTNENQNNKPKNNSKRPNGNSTAKKGPNKNNKNRNKNNWNKGNNRSRSNKPGNFIVKYQNILEQYLSVRKKYFELFFRADPKQKAKLERNYYNELKKLNDFEARLNDKQKEELKLHTTGKSLDTKYSVNHESEMESYGTSIEDSAISDPHYLESQQSPDWKSDQEESTGSLEDYQNYKDSI